MTEFKRHNGQGLKITGAFVRPDKREDQVLAEKVVLVTDKHGEVSYKPRYSEEVKQEIDGMPVPKKEKRKYSVTNLPTPVKQLVKKAQQDTFTVTADIGEAINDGESSYYIPQGEFDSIERQDTLFDGEEKDEVIE